ncbi:MAG TPA: T9SS type A sorting domain-containing protein [Chitinophagales bacterium]|nr:T9SS type A sorting domain-containing protein [Chitinophagales bacterium]
MTFPLLAQSIDIPDNNLKNVLIARGVDTNNDGEIQESEALVVDSLNIAGKEISNLKGIEFFKNLVYLNCSYNSLLVLDVSQLTQLKYLNFTYNKLSTINLNSTLQLESLFGHFNGLISLDLNQLVNLKEFGVSSNKITSLSIKNLTKLEAAQFDYNLLTSIELKNLPSLKVLQCPGNKMTELDLTGLNNLEYLSCYYSSLTSLNISGLTKLESISSEGCKNLTTLTLNNLPSLKELYFKECNLRDVLISNSDSIETIDFRKNQIEILDISSLTNLREILCDNNQISDLKTGVHDKLETISCSNNQISKIEFKPLNSLTYLECSNNLLKELDLSNIVNIGALRCNNNQLSSIDLCPLKDLQILDCSGNQLKELDVSQHKMLYTLNCSRNQLTQLDISFLGTLMDFNCTYNPLEILYIKNGIYNMMSCPYSPPYPCYKYQIFDSVPHLKYICTDASEIEEFKQVAINNGYSNIIINSFCSSFIDGTFYTLNGQIKLDLDNDGCDETDLNFPYAKTKIFNAIDTGFIIAGTDGNFSTDLNAGTYTFQPVINYSNYYTVHPETATITLPDTISPAFCIKPNGIHNDLTVAIIPVRAARPGFSDATYKVVYKNKGNTTQSGTFTFNYDEDKMNFISSSPIADNTGAGNVSFYFSNLKPFETRSALIAMRTNSPTDNPAVNSGDVLEFTATIIGAIDETPEDNLATLTQTVVGSFDPNDKTCLEGEIVSPELIGKNVHYLIRFENTGTANAENIVVTDYIDTAVFDISTLQITDASHTCHTQISQGNKVQFIFNDIQLPFTEPDKHGYVAFSIKLKEDLVIGDSIKNKADIFFDYNLPIETNIASAEINYRTITYIGKNQTLQGSLDIYPNPSNGQFVLELKANIKAPVQISILNVEGKTVFAKSINHQNQSNLSLDLKHLAKGIYLIKAQIENEVVSEKVLIQ